MIGLLQIWCIFVEPLGTTSLYSRKMLISHMAECKDFPVFHKIVLDLFLLFNFCSQMEYQE